MKCPHCAVTVHVAITSVNVVYQPKGSGLYWKANHTICPHCKQAIIWLVCFDALVYRDGSHISGTQIASLMVWPQSSERPIPTEVPDDISRDFAEAVRVLPISAQSSAALTRRTLQQILRDHGKTTKRDLHDQIQEMLDAEHLPSSLAKQLHAVRVIGNFAAHPLKSKTTGLILPVEPNEAEWNLDVLEDMFDFFFVKPAQTQKRLDELNRKLLEAGKPEL